MRSGNKKKITVITGTFHPDIGGPPTYLMNLLTEITERNLAEVTVITYGRNTVDYPFRVIRISRSWPVIIKLLVFVVKCLFYGRKGDIWYVNDYGMPAILANLFLGKKIVLKVAGDFAWEYSLRHGHIRDINIDEFQNYWLSKTANLLKFIQKLYVSKADCILTPSNYLKKIITGWGIEPDKIEVVYNAIKQEKYRSDLCKKDARKLFNLPLDGIVILTIARLIRWKGIDSIIEKSSHLKEEIYYAIAGDGPDMFRLKEITEKLKMQSRVFFLGMVDHSQIPHLLRASDVFVLNSKYEGLPHVILEAAALGIPCLVADQAGIKEAINMANCGLVMRDDFSEDIKKALTLKQIRLSKELQWDYLFSKMAEMLELG